MKIQRILILLAVLVSLTAAALADQTYTPYTQAEVNSFVYHMPAGLSYTVSAQEGHAQVLVDSAKTDWTQVAAQSALLDGVEFTFDVPTVGNAAHSKSGSFFVDPTYYDTLDEAMDDLYRTLEPGNNSGGWGTLAAVSDGTSTIIPTVYDQNKPMLVMGLYYDGSGQLISARYATLYITYTDASAKRVEFAGVPAERMENKTALSGASKVSMSQGLVNYELEAGAGSQVSLTVTPPDGAKCYSMKNGSSVGLGNGKSDCNGDLQLSIGVPAQNDAYIRRKVAFIWIGENDSVLGVESLAVNVSVGDPKPWINYESGLELPDASKGEIQYAIEGVQELKGIKPVYEDGTITVAPTNEDFLVSGEPDQMRLAISLKAPDGAATYKYASYDESNILGVQEGAYERFQQYVQQENARAVPDGGTVRIGELSVFKCAEYQNDPGLKVYYDANPTDRANGHIIMVEWYAKDGTPLSRQALAIQFESMAVEVKTIVEVAVPDAAQDPTLIAEKASSGYALQVMSYPQTGDAQRHYELRLLNSNGEVQPVSALGSNAQLLIPYPDGMDQSSEEQFAINHYTTGEPPEVQEMFSEARGNITRTQAGLLLTVKSLSPFVISWGKPVHEHELVYTASGSTLTQTCRSCGHSATATLEIKDSFAKGEKVSASVSVSAGWQGDKPAIAYASKDGQALAAAPTASGSYSVSMTMGDAKVTCYFTIADPAVLPQTGDDSLPLTVLVALMLLSAAGVIWLSRRKRID